MYAVTITDGRIDGLYHADRAPAEAVAVSNEVGERLRRISRFGDWCLVEGGLVCDPVPDEPTPEQLRAQAKAARTAAVARIVVEVSTGKTFDGDEDSQTRMARAIIGMQAAAVSTITWTLADNTIADVTLAEITEALILAGQQQATLWPIP